MDKCPTFQTADILGKKWTIALMQEIVLNGEKGFNAIFKRMTKISPKILARRLKELEDSGIVEKEVLSDKVPLRTKYKLTKKGEEFYKIVQQIKLWSIKHSSLPHDCMNNECVQCPLY